MPRLKFPEGSIAPKLRDLRDHITTIDLSDGRDEIVPFARKQIMDRLLSHLRIGLPEDWNWDWTGVQMIGETKLQGTLPKRIAQYYHVATGKHVDDYDIASIGGIVGQYRAPHNVHHFDINSTLGWRAGAFGDRGSCFWASHTDDRYAMKHSHFMAMRFYDRIENRDGETTMRGRARAWLAPDQPATGMFTTFNAYGLHHSTMATVLAQYLGLSCRYFSIQCDRRNGEPVYTNGDGYAYGTQEQLDRLAHIIDYYGPGSHLLYVCSDKWRDKTRTLDDYRNYIKTGWY